MQRADEAMVLKLVQGDGSSGVEPAYEKATRTSLTAVPSGGRVACCARVSPMSTGTRPPQGGLDNLTMQRECSGNAAK